MNVIVMPGNFGSLKRADALFEVDITLAHQVCDSVIDNQKGVLDRLLSEMAHEEVTKRLTKSSWWQKPFRGSTDHDEVLNELRANGSPWQDAILIATMRQRVALAAARRIKSLVANDQGCVVVEQTDWSVVLRIYTKISTPLKADTSDGPSTGSDVSRINVGPCSGTNG